MAGGAAFLILRSSARSRAAAHGSLSHHYHTISPGSPEKKCVKPDMTPIEIRPVSDREAYEALLFFIMIVFIVISLFLIF